jgi:hypothetical protein
MTVFQRNLTELNLDKDYMNECHKAKLDVRGISAYRFTHADVMTP